MKITDEMVEKACEADYGSVGADWKNDPSESERIAQRREMRKTLEVVFANLNRWTFFSEDELKELMAGCVDRESTRALPVSSRAVATVLVNQLNHELRHLRGGYQGPGVYKSSGGMEWKVIGRIGESGPIVMSAPGLDHFLYSETWNDFNRLHDGGIPVYRYLRQLGEQ